MGNNGKDTVCGCCGADGNTANDLTWDEEFSDWLCPDCSEGGPDLSGYVDLAAAARRVEE